MPTANMHDAARKVKHTTETWPCPPLGMPRGIFRNQGGSALTLLLSNLAQVLTRHLDCSLCDLFGAVGTAVPRFADLKEPARLCTSAAHACSVTNSNSKVVAS